MEQKEFDPDFSALPYGTKDRYASDSFVQEDYNDQVSAFMKGKYDLALLTYDDVFTADPVASPFTLGHLGLIVSLMRHSSLQTPTRGINVELLLTFILAAKEKGISPQIIALSAVIGERK